MSDSTTNRIKGYYQLIYCYRIGRLGQPSFFTRPLLNIFSSIKSWCVAILMCSVFLIRWFNALPLIAYLVFVIVYRIGWWDGMGCESTTSFEFTSIILSVLSACFYHVSKLLCGIELNEDIHLWRIVFVFYFCDILN